MNKLPYVFVVSMSLLGGCASDQPLAVVDEAAQRQARQQQDEAARERAAQAQRELDAATRR